MRLQVEFQLNTASEEDITEYLLGCDMDFSPPLSTRVRIIEYAKKIVDRATRFEAWFDGKLVGLVAAYCNDMENRVAYITNVNVSKLFTSNGIASHLLGLIIEYSKAEGMIQISLEVSKDNAPAIKLYEKYGFIVSTKDMSIITMNLNLKSRGKDDIKKKL